MSTLTTGCLNHLLSRSVLFGNPIVQILNIKKLETISGEDGYRVGLFDGKFSYGFVMLDSSLNGMVTDGTLTDFKIIKILKYTTTICKKQNGELIKILIILNVEVVNNEQKLGNPIPVVLYVFTNGVAEILPKPLPSIEATAVQPELASNNKINEIILPISKTKDTLFNVISITPNTSASVVSPSITTTKSTDIPDIKKHAKKKYIINKHANLIQPIMGLLPGKTRWMIKAKVSAKSTIKLWRSSVSEGKLFNIDFLDESGEIRATAFRACVERFYEYFEVNKVYYICNGTIKRVQVNLSSTNQSYQIMFNENTRARLCNEKIPIQTFPILNYNCMPLDVIQKCEPNSLIDVIGICQYGTDLLYTIDNSTGAILVRREITLIDRNYNTISVLLGRTEAEIVDPLLHQVIMIKRGFVAELNGKNIIGSFVSSILIINPDMKEAHLLRKWFDINLLHHYLSRIFFDRFPKTISICTEYKTLYELKIETVRDSPLQEFFLTKAIIYVFRAKNILQRCCPKEDCNGKVSPIDNAYRCSDCSELYNNCRYKFLLHLCISDFTLNKIGTLLHDVAESFLINNLSKSAKKDIDVMDMLHQLHFKQVILKVRTNFVNHQYFPTRKVTIVGVTNINYKEYNKYLINNIQNIIERK